MPRQRTPETSLYGPVKRYLEKRGFTVKGEVCGCDLVALREEEPVVVIGEPKARQVFREMAETWNRLAAETESDQTLFQSISEMELGEPDDALPTPLKLRLGEYA
jgi:hypothetical protein